MEPSPKVSERYLPSNAERECLFNLIDHSSETLVSDHGYDPRAQNTDLYAMIDVGNRYGFGLSPAAKKHLRRMIVLQVNLLSELREDEILHSTLSIALGPESSEFASFSVDFSDMTEIWREALTDVLKRLGDVDAPPTE